MDKSKLTCDVTKSLEGHLLIAAPALQDPFFQRAVIYMCSHDAAGAMGVIVNYPVQNIKVNDILDQLDIQAGDNRDLPIHFGGPVDANRGFVVHSSDYTAEGNIIEKNGISVSANIAVLQALAEGRGPTNGMLVLGYAGWSAGQLEDEIEKGSWIIAAADPKLVFATGDEKKWSNAVASLGIELGHFSSQVGHA
ncbi:MAG: YqgE/AlgH family protein [Alphaproteobacteria bacterium]